MKFWNRFRFPPSVDKVEVIIAEHAAEMVVIESIRTVLFYVRVKDTPIEKDYADFIAHLKRRGYHLVLIG